MKKIIIYDVEDVSTGEVIVKGFLFASSPLAECQQREHIKATTITRRSDEATSIRLIMPPSEPLAA